MKSITTLLAVILMQFTLQQSPVYNVREADPSKDPNRPFVPQLTTDYQTMVTDRSKRIITLGEPAKNPETQVEFSPITHYDEDVEFVSDKKPEAKGTINLPVVLVQNYDDKQLKAKETLIEQMVYSLYELNSEDDKKQFLKAEASPISQFLIIIGTANQPLLLQEIHILDQVRDLIAFMRKQEEALKQTNNQEALDYVRNKVKTLSFLLDQRDY